MLRYIARIYLTPPDAKLKDWKRYGSGDDDIELFVDEPLLPGETIFLTDNMMQFIVGSRMRFPINGNEQHLLNKVVNLHLTPSELKVFGRADIIKSLDSWFPKVSCEP